MLHASAVRRASAAPEPGASLLEPACTAVHPRPLTHRSQYVLAKKGPLAKIWLAAHMEKTWEKKVPKLQVIATNIPDSVDNIENPKFPMALRVSGHLLLGVVRIFSKKVAYLLTDCSEALVKIKDAIRAPGTVDLPQGATTRRHEDITNTDQFDEMDLEADLASQEMSFAMSGDDALVGISIPEQDLDNGNGLEDATPVIHRMEGEPDDEGFGATNPLIYFEQEVRRARGAPIASAPRARARVPLLAFCGRFCRGRASAPRAAPVPDEWSTTPLASVRPRHAVHAPDACRLGRRNPVSRIAACRCCSAPTLGMHATLVRAGGRRRRGPRRQASPRFRPRGGGRD